MIPQIKRIIKQIAQTIQRGERTHNQLQVILPRSLRTMNTIVSRPQKPIPPELAEELSDIIELICFIFLIQIYYNYLISQNYSEIVDEVSFSESSLPRIFNDALTRGCCGSNSDITAINSRLSSISLLFSASALPQPELSS